MRKVPDRDTSTSGAEPPVVSAEMRELIRRVSCLPRGLAFLDQGSLECVAITFGVHSDLVLEARSYLADPTHRVWLLEQVKSQQSAEPKPWHAPRPCCASEPPGPRTAAGLIHAAEQHQYGVSFLLESPPETVAIVFHVHPQMVFRARTLFARWRARTDREPSS